MTAPARPKAADPENLYEYELKIAKAGVKFEARLGCEYLGPTKADYDHLPYKKGVGKISNMISAKEWDKMHAIIEECPAEWKLPEEFYEACERGVDTEDGVPVRVPCCMEICPDCNQAKKRERRFLRELAKKDQDWSDLPLHMKRKYITFWMDNNPLSHSDRDKLDPEYKQVAKMARTIFSNVPKPPIEDACVTINILAGELNIEEIMDDVTSAMSIDALMNEVGEKTAFRRRLLMAWQMVHQLRYNVQIQRRNQHIFNAFIIILTFVSVLLGTIYTMCKKELDRGESTGEPPMLYGFRVYQTAVDIMNVLNLLLPMLTSLFYGLDAAFSPATKYMALYHQQLYVESEIYKVRTRTGEYSPHAVSSGVVQGSEAGKGDADSKGEKKDAKKGGGGGGYRAFFFRLCRPGALVLAMLARWARVCRMLNLCH